MKSPTTSASKLATVLFALSALVLLILITLIARDFSHIIINQVKSGNGDVYDYVQAHYVGSVLLFMLVYIVAATVSLPIESALSVVAGYYFGVVVGTAAVVVSATIGAFAIFILIKYYFNEWFHRNLKSENIKKIIDGINKNSFSYLLFLRLVPLFPFFIINLALSFSTVRKRDYILATFIGVIPGAFVFVLAGTQLASIHDTRSLVSPKTVAVLILLSLFALGPLMWRKLLARREERSDSLASKETLGINNSPLTPDKVHHKEIKHSDGNDNK